MELGDTGITVGSPSPKCFLYLAQVLESNHSEVFWRQGQNNSLCARTIFVREDDLELLDPPASTLGSSGVTRVTDTPPHPAIVVFRGKTKHALGLKSSLPFYR